MKPVVVLLCCLVPFASGASDDCTFDQDHQATVITSIAARFPGASPNVEGRTVTWVSPSEGTTTFEYGGCADLGSTITRSTQLAAPRTQAQVFALARELATRFWSNDIVSARLASETLLTALSNSKYMTEKLNGKVSFSVSDPSYVQLYIEHEYKDGVDRVVLAWQGNF